MTLLERALWSAQEWRLRRLRRKLDSAFSPETAAQGFPSTTPSAGQCAAVSVIVHFGLGAELASARVQGLSHWFNRFPMGADALDVDLTGDQFGFPPVQVASSGALYNETRRREPTELHLETLERAARLAQLAGLETIRAKIQQALAARHDSASRQGSRSLSHVG